MATYNQSSKKSIELMKNMQRASAWQRLPEYKNGERIEGSQAVDKSTGKPLWFSDFIQFGRFGADVVRVKVAAKTQPIADAVGLIGDEETELEAGELR